MSELVNAPIPDLGPGFYDDENNTLKKGRIFSDDTKIFNKIKQMAQNRLLEMDILDEKLGSSSDDNYSSFAPSVTGKNLQNITENEQDTFEDNFDNINHLDRSVH